MCICVYICAYLYTYYCDIRAYIQRNLALMCAPRRVWRLAIEKEQDGNAWAGTAAHAYRLVWAITKYLCNQAEQLSMN
jgi:hypothetical protein